MQTCTIVTKSMTIYKSSEITVHELNKLREDNKNILILKKRI